MAKFEYDYEYIIIDNCSSDNTIQIIKKIAKDDKKLRLFKFQKLWTHKIFSIWFITINRRCNYPLSSDLQEPPELISKYIEEWENGYKIVQVKGNNR